MVCYTDLGLAAIIAHNSVGQSACSVVSSRPPWRDAAGRGATGMPALYGLDVDLGDVGALLECHPAHVIAVLRCSFSKPSPVPKWP
jgi:hypothetical protein